MPVHDVMEQHGAPSDGQLERQAATQFMTPWSSCLWHHGLSQHADILKMHLFCKIWQAASFGCTSGTVTAGEGCLAP